MNPEHEALGQRLYAAESEIKELREIVGDIKAQANRDRRALNKRLDDADSRVYELECESAANAVDRINAPLD